VDNSADLVRGAPPTRVLGVTMSRIFKSIGHGLLAAGALLFVIYLLGVYVKGIDALRDALDPLVLRNYLVLAPLVPGALLLWLSDYIAARRGRSPRTDLPAAGTE
jgi:hypothetical protein